MKRFYRLASFLAGIALIIALLLIFGTEYYLEFSDPEGYRNSQICPTLKPGITVSDLKNALGEPFKTEGHGEQRFAFRANSIAAGPIQAEIDEGTGNVIELRCNEDGPSNWTVRRQ